MAVNKCDPRGSYKNLGDMVAVACSNPLLISCMNALSATVLAGFDGADGGMKFWEIGAVCKGFVYTTERH